MVVAFSLSHVAKSLDDEESTIVVVAAAAAAASVVDLVSSSPSCVLSCDMIKTLLSVTGCLFVVF